MRSTTHFLFSVICLLFYFTYFSVKHPFLFIVLALITTLCVDIDYSGSKVGKLTQPFSSIIHKILGHRGLLHSMLVPICLFIIIQFLGYPEQAIAVLIGYVSHIVLDMMTPAGIKIFYPLQYNISGPIRTGSWAEKILIILFVIVIMLKLFFSFSGYSWL